MGENDQKISLLDRVAQHARATAKYAVWYGEGRDFYDVRGRTAHESVFNVNDGNYRCPNSQQGYSPFSTWTRGLAWAMCGFAEQLELFDTLDGPRGDQGHHGEGRPRHLRFLHRAHPARRHPLLGHRRPRPRAAGRLAIAHRPTRTTRTSPWTAPPPPSARKACCASAAD